MFSITTTASPSAGSKARRVTQQSPGLRSGADPKIALPTGETPLMTASRSGNANVVKSLVDNLVKPMLIQHDIAYRVYGGLRFFERQEIKHALAYLRLLASDEGE